MRGVRKILMLRLEIDLSVDDDDLEDAVTSAIRKSCSEELESLRVEMGKQWHWSVIYGHHVYGEIRLMMPRSLYQLTDTGRSVVGRMLAGEPVVLMIAGSEVGVERNSVICNVLTVLVPMLSDQTLAELMSDWTLTSGGRGFERAISEYYLQTARDRRHALSGPCASIVLGLQKEHRELMVYNQHCSESLVAFEHDPHWVRPSTLESLVEDRAAQHESYIHSTAEPVEAAAGSEDGVCALQRQEVESDPSQKVLRVLFRMLSTNGQDLRRGRTGNTRNPGSMEQELTWRFGVRLPSLEELTRLDEASLLDVCYASWYLSTRDCDNVGKAFRAAMRGGEVEEADAEFVDATFVRILRERPHVILQAMAPHCRGCYGSIGAGSHSGGCGTRALVACLVPTHALQLLELLVVHHEKHPLEENGIVWA